MKLARKNAPSSGGARAHVPLHDRAYTAIGTALMTGRLAPGQSVTIRGLATALGISPTPIREAVRRLVAEGTLALLANRRLRVPTMTAAELEELREIRLALEGLATRLAAERMTAGDLAALESIDAAIVAARGRRDVRRMMAEIQRFHHAVYRLAGRPALMRLIEAQWRRSGPWIGELFTGYAAQERGRLRRRFLDALARGDHAEACATMAEDISAALAYLVERARARALDPHESVRREKQKP